MDRVAFTRNTLRDFVSHLSLWVIHDNIIICHQKRIGNFTLCRETFAGAGSTQNQAIGVLQFLPVYHNQVVGQSIQAIIQAFFAGLVQFLCGERNEDCRAAGSQSPLNFDLAVCQWQAAHQPLLLLKVKAAQVAVVLLCNAGCLKNVVFQFLLRAPGVQNKERHQKHSLVLALQLFEQGFRIPSVSCQVGRDNVNIIPGADGFFLVE